MPTAFEYNILRFKNVHPSMSYTGGDPALWQAAAKKKLSELLGLDRFEKAAPETAVEFDRQQPGFREIRFSFQSETGYRVPCHLWLPDGVQRPPLMICLQGHSTGMHISMGRPKYENDAVTISGGDRDFCVRAVQEGFAALALEQRNFGECGGTEKGPSCQNPSLTNMLIGRTTIGERVWDVSRCVDTLISDFKEFVKPDEIYALGNSGGGTCTVYATALEERLAGGVPSCAVSTYASSIGAMPHCACNFVPNIRKYFDMAEILMMAAPRKLVVVSGAEDKIFPIAGAKQMVEEAKAAFAAAGVPDRIFHAIGEEGHRFYADIAWDALKKMK